MAKRAGITHFALEQERDSQRRVPPRGQAKEDVDTSTPGKRRRATAGGRHAPMSAGPDTRVARRSVKGGLSSGSRAGLTASRKARARK